MIKSELGLSVIDFEVMGPRYVDTSVEPVETIEEAGVAVGQAVGGHAVADSVEITEGSNDIVAGPPEINEEGFSRFCEKLELNVRSTALLRAVLKVPGEVWFRSGQIKPLRVDYTAAHRTELILELRRAGLLDHNGLPKGQSRQKVNAEAAKSYGLFGDDYDPVQVKKDAERIVSLDNMPDASGKPPRKTRLNKSTSATNAWHQRRQEAKVLRNGAPYDYNLAAGEFQADTSNPIVAFIVEGTVFDASDLMGATVRKALSQLAGQDILGDDRVMSRYSHIQEIYRDTRDRVFDALGEASLEVGLPLYVESDTQVERDSVKKIELPKINEYAVALYALDAGLTDRQYEMLKSLLTNVPVRTWFRIGLVEVPDSENLAERRPADVRTDFAKLLVEQGLLLHNGKDRGGSRHQLSTYSVERHQLYQKPPSAAELAAQQERFELNNAYSLSQENDAADYIVNGRAIDLDQVDSDVLYQAFQELNRWSLLKDKNLCKRWKLVGDELSERVRVGSDVMLNEIFGDPDSDDFWAFGNCKGVDPELFFPERGASTKEAKQVCQGCVVREECLEYALSNGEKFGIWGGLSERERRRIRRQRALARAAQQSRTAEVAIEPVPEADDEDDDLENEAV